MEQGELIELVVQALCAVRDIKGEDGLMVGAQEMLSAVAVIIARQSDLDFMMQALMVAGEAARLALEQERESDPQGSH